MDPEGFVLGPRAKRAISLVAAALTVIVAGGLLFIHPPSTSSARFVGVPPPPTLSHAYAAHFDFVDSQHGWASVQRFGTTAITTIYRTGDGAHSWRPVFRLHAAEQVQSLHFWDRTNGIVEADHVYTTSDAGAHWNLISVPDSTSTLAFASPREGLAIDGGRVFATHDGGLTWQMRGFIPDWSNFYMQNGLQMLDFRTGGEAWVGGVSNKPVVSASSDGGATWTVRELPFATRVIPSGKPLFFEASVRSLSRGAVFVLARDPFGDAQSFESVDGGLTWSSTRLPWANPDAALAYMSFVGVSSWWASSHGLLYRTTDAGNTWKSIETVLPPVLDNMDPGAIHMVDANFGWAAATGPGGTSLLASSDGGHNWKLVNVPQPA